MILPLPEKPTKWQRDFCLGLHRERMVLRYDVSEWGSGIRTWILFHCAMCLGTDIGAVCTVSKGMV